MTRWRHLDGGREGISLRPSRHDVRSAGDAPSGAKVERYSTGMWEITAAFVTAACTGRRTKPGAGGAVCTGVWSLGAAPGRARRPPRVPVPLHPVLGRLHQGPFGHQGRPGPVFPHPDRFHDHERSTAGAGRRSRGLEGLRRRGPVSVGPGGDVCRRPRRPGGGGRRRPATAGLRQLVVPPRFKRVDQAPHGTAAPHLKRFAAEKRPFPARGDTQGAMTASIVLSRRCKMTVCND